MADDNTNGQTTGAENGSQGGSTSNDGAAPQGGNAGEQYMTTQQFNSAMSSWNKRNQEATAKAFTEQLQQALSPFQEMMQGMSQGDTTTKALTAEGGTSKPNDQQNPELLKIQRQMQDLQKLLDNEKQEKVSAQTKARDERVKSEVLKTLSELGVQKGDQVFKLIKDNLVYEDENSIKFRGMDSQINMEIESGLKSGLTDWLNNEGTHYLPAKVSGGSGASSSRMSSGNRVVDLDALNKMKPSELAKVNLADALGADVLKSFLGQ